jgi:hypothetical protein
MHVTSSSVFLLVALSSVPASAAGPFDGIWRFDLSCPRAPDGALGYNWSFPARIVNGRISGQYNSEGTNSSGTLRGQVGSNGRARVQINGRTGDPKYSVNRVRAGYPFSAVADVMFHGNQGSGERRNVRPCTLTFNR